MKEIIKVLTENNEIFDIKVILDIVYKEKLFNDFNLKYILNENLEIENFEIDNNFDKLKEIIDICNYNIKQKNITNLINELKKFDNTYIKLITIQFKYKNLNITFELNENYEFIYFDYGGVFLDQNTGSFLVKITNDFIKNLRNVRKRIKNES